jgi:hypothetical protein
MSHAAVTINRFAIFPCTVPDKAQRLEVRYCGCCGCPFVRPITPTLLVTATEEDGWDHARITMVRRREMGKRYCIRCERTGLRPNIKAQEQYRALLPKEPEQRHSHHLPRYDNSLQPKETNHGGL